MFLFCHQMTLKLIFSDTMTKIYKMECTIIILQTITETNNNSVDQATQICRLNYSMDIIYNKNRSSRDVAYTKQAMSST